MEIVFVHFGSIPPKYLIRNLNRTCEFFPDTKVTLITDVELDFEVKHSNFQNHQFELGTDYQQVNRQINHPKNFRQNFWFTSLARVIALCDYVIENNVAVLHIESDVLVSQDLPLQTFEQCDRSIAYTMVGELSGVASVLWLGDKSAAMRLRDYVNFQVQTDSMTTDMKILGQYQTDYPQQVRILASFPTRLSGSCSSISTQIVEDMIYSEDLFCGFFDAADVGQYLLGDDPRNHRGMKFVRRELFTSFFKPSKVSFQYSKSRRFINVASGSFNRYYSLHIHSKTESVFTEKKIERVLLRAVEKQSRPEKCILVPSVLLASIRHSLIRRFHKLTEFKK
jgi:hypothetical protein